MRREEIRWRGIREEEKEGQEAGRGGGRGEGSIFDFLEIFEEIATLSGQFF